MRLLIFALVAIVPISLRPALACSGTELAEKMKQFSAATAARYAQDPSGDEARKARVQVIIDRYRSLKSNTNGAAIVDATCREYDELIAVYQ